MSQQPTQTKKQFFLDRGLLFLLIAMALFSLVAIYCAEPLMTSSVRSGNPPLKQAIWYCAGFIMIYILFKFGTDRLFTGAKVFYWILIVLLAILLVDRYLFNLPDMLIRPVNGTTAWYQIPKLGTFQPSEFMKVILIILVANTIDEHNKNKTEISIASDIELFIKVLKIITLPLILILLQPDTGIPIIIVISILLMLSLSGIHKGWVYAGTLILIVGFFGIIYLYYNYPHILNELLGGGYRLRRFYGWLDAEKYSTSDGMQLYTALLTIGASGLTGLGLRTKVIGILEPHTDFIFAVIAQNFGFLGTMSVVLLSLLLDFKLLSIARRHDDPRCRAMVAGMIGMLLFQQIQNMGMVVGLLPITGITLPFISYGGSSMLSYMIPLAVVFTMSSENKNRLLH